MKKLFIFFTLILFISSEPFDGSIRNKQSFFKVIARDTFLKAVPIYNTIELINDGNDENLNNPKMFIYNEEKNGDFLDFLKTKQDLYQGFIGKIDLATESLKVYQFENIVEQKVENENFILHYHFYKSYTFKNSSGKRLIFDFYGKVKGKLNLKRTIKNCNSGIFELTQCKTETKIDKPDENNLTNYFRDKLEKLCIEKIKSQFYDSLNSL